MHGTACICCPDSIVRLRPQILATCNACTLVEVCHGVKLEHDFFYDFLIEDKIGVELKAVAEIVGEFEAQIINYLHVSNHKLGLLLNFGATSLEYKWYPNEWHHRDCASIG